MKHAEGGHIPGPIGTAGSKWKLCPGEYLINRDGRIWRVTDDGAQVELVAEPQEES